MVRISTNLCRWNLVVVRRSEQVGVPICNMTIKAHNTPRRSESGFFVDVSLQLVRRQIYILNSTSEMPQMEW